VRRVGWRDLREARLPLAAARALNLASEDEPLNLRLALWAAEAAPRLRVVVRLFDLELGRELERRLRTCALSVSALAARPSPSRRSCRARCWPCGAAVPRRKRRLPQLRAAAAVRRLPRGRRGRRARPLRARDPHCPGRV